MSKTQKNVGKKTFKKVAKKKVSKPSKKTGLKKKVVSMKLKRKVKKVHRKKMKRGGSQYLRGVTDLGKIWNSILLKKGKDEGLIELIEETHVKETPVKETPDENKTYVLFVIDMQNDFSDAEYKRKGVVQRFKNENNYERNLTESGDYSTPYPVPDNENNACLPPKEDKPKEDEPKEDEPKEDEPKEDETPTTIPTTIGNFNVAGVNNSLIGNLVNKIQKALKDDNCTEIIFTRDYHPDGHMSFSRTSSSFVPQYCTCEGGNFPVHCLQGHSGSRLIPAIESLLLDTKIGGKEKVRILFKGFDLNCDSFTAVPKDKDDIGIDNYASNQKQIKPCSSLSGAYDLAKSELGAAAYIQAALDYNEHTLSTKLPPYVNGENFGDVAEFQVCGLAGDYCVRDTVVSLAKMFPTKQVRLLGGLTRYAVLPLFTMRSVPIHNYIGDMKVPNIDATGYVDLLVKDPSVKSEVVEDSSDNSEVKLVINSEVVDNFNAIYTDKSLYYYTLTLGNSGYQLVQTTADRKGLTEEVSTTNFVFPDGTNGKIANKFFHFITPPEVIIEDYKANSTKGNIKIRLYNNRNLTKSDVIIPATEEATALIENV